jgi:hypothetical protein
MEMTVAELIKYLEFINKNYKVKMIISHGYPEVVIVDF